MNHKKINRAWGLYIHIPFCKAKCRYCGSASFPGLLNHIGRYLKALEKEMDFYKNRTVDTIYFGGGTPSILNKNHWMEIMRNIRSRFILAAPTEITMECNPENITAELAGLYKKEGVNRMSLGLQTTDDRLLKKIGRTYTWKDFLGAYKMCRDEEMRNISVDLIFGLPGQTLAGWKKTVEHILKLHPEHLSLYPLDVEEKSAFYCDGINPDLDLQADMFEWCSGRIESEGYEHYELFSFSLPEYECKHNLKYWKNLPHIGLGPSAAGYNGDVRYNNGDLLSDYMDRLEAGEQPNADREILSAVDKLREEMLLGLRLKEGIILKKEIEIQFGPILKRLLTDKLLKKSADGTRLLPTQKGWLLSSHIYRELLG